MSVQGFFAERAIPYLVLWRNRKDIALTELSVGYFIVFNKQPQDQRYSAPDIIVDAFRDIYMRHQSLRHISDTLVYIAAGLALLFCLCQKKMSSTILRRYIVTTGSIYLLRAPFVAFTVLPSPYHLCPVTYKENILYDSILLLAQMRVSCGDVFFSGHTILFTTTLLVYSYYAPRYLSLPVALLCVAGMFSLVATTYHYTIDVLAAFLFTYGFWVVYHWAFRIPDFRKKIVGKAVAFWEEVGPEGSGRWKLRPALVSSKHDDIEVGQYQAAPEMVMIQVAGEKENVIEPLATVREE